VVVQYLPDLPEGCAFSLKLAIAGNVPLGDRLEKCCLSLSGDCPVFRVRLGGARLVLRCQKAENDWCHFPSGMIDQ
jgi:hypothetical protein